MTKNKRKEPSNFTYVETIFSINSGILNWFDETVLLFERTQNVTKTRRFCVAFTNTNAVLLVCFGRGNPKIYRMLLNFHALLQIDWCKFLLRFFRSISRCTRNFVSWIYWMERLTKATLGIQSKFDNFSSTVIDFIHLIFQKDFFLKWKDYYCTKCFTQFKWFSSANIIFYFCNFLNQIFCQLNNWFFAGIWFRCVRWTFWVLNRLDHRLI